MTDGGPIRRTRPPCFARSDIPVTTVTISTITSINFAMMMTKMMRVMIIVKKKKEVKNNNMMMIICVMMLSL